MNIGINHNVFVYSVAICCLPSFRASHGPVKFTVLLRRGNDCSKKRTIDLLA
jgi:hypothetical protein